MKIPLPIYTLIISGALGLAGCTTATDKSEELSHQAKSTGASIDKFAAYTQKYTRPILLTQNHATGHVGDFFFTHWKDGGSASLNLSTDGAFSVKWQGGGYNYVGGPGWHYGDEDRVIGYRFNEDSGANFITLYGWGYDKDMPESNPAHLSLGVNPISPAICRQPRQLFIFDDTLPKQMTNDGRKLWKGVAVSRKRVP